jgi:hypothetical protein
MGTSNGKIRICNWPLNDTAFEWEQINPNSSMVIQHIPEFQELAVCSSAITQLVITAKN